MTRIPTKEVKQRSRRATKFFESYRSFDELVGSVQSILITEVSSDGKHYVGHNKNYNQVLVEKDPRLMGQVVDVLIKKCSKWSLEGTVVPESLEVITNGNVEPRRIPKLVRIHRQVVVMDEDGNKDGNKDQRDDGTIFSTGTRLVKRKQRLPWLCIGLTIPVVLAPIRTTLKIAIIATGFMAYSIFNK
jgi:hypothetical protein